MTKRRVDVSVIIATRNRPDPLRGTLSSLAAQSVAPRETIVVDGSDDQRSLEVCDEARAANAEPLQHIASHDGSSARARNRGATMASGSILLFLDDDVVLESPFLAEISGVFERDAKATIGGVSGTVSNQVYVPPSRATRLALCLIAGLPLTGSYAGRLLGPAVNFLPDDAPPDEKDVDWLNSTGTAYRRDVFAITKFPDSFDGYSFMEDVHLSARVRKTHRLVNSRRARFFHLDLGQRTHADWSALGESMVRHRHRVMIDALGRSTRMDHARLAAFELVYGTIASVRGGDGRRALALLRGRVRGLRGIRKETRRERSGT